MNELRKIEVLENGEWKQIRLQSVKVGQQFRMFEDGELVTHNGESIFIAETSGYINDSGIGEINVSIDN